MTAMSEAAHGEGQTEHVPCGQLLAHLTARLQEGWFVRSVQLDHASMGVPGHWTGAGGWSYWVRLMRLGEEERP